jgi:hypothetical protein
VLYEYFVGVDLGQAQDYTALAAVERKDYKYDFSGPREQLHVRHLQRFALGISYPSIVERVKDMLSRPPLRGRAALVVDATGVGRPVVDLFRKEGLQPIAVTITGGSGVNVVLGGGYRVPKRDLVTNLQVQLQAGRLKIAGQLPEAKILVEELLAFKVKIDPRTAHDSYEAWREGVHDDLVLAVALASWYAEKYKKMAPIPKPAGW